VGFVTSDDNALLPCPFQHWFLCKPPVNLHPPLHLFPVRHRFRSKKGFVSEELVPKAVFMHKGSTQNKGSVISENWFQTNKLLFQSQKSLMDNLLVMAMALY